MNTPNASETVAPSEDGFAVSDEVITPLLEAILRQAPSASHTVARMTAVRIIRERSLPGYDEVLRRMAAGSGGEHMVARMAAIAALARSEAAGNHEFLRSLDRTDARIAAALEHSLPANP